MVCHRCCQIVVQLHNYRVQAVANDKKLQEENGEPYVPPVTDSEELQRVSLEILTKSEPLAHQAVDQNDTCAKHTDIRKLPTRKVSLESQRASHISIRNLRKQYPYVKLPGVVCQSDVSPVVPLDKNEVENWQKEKLKRCFPSSAQVSIQRGVNNNEPKSINSLIVTKTSDSISPRIHEPKVSPSLVSDSSKHLNNKPTIRFYKPSSKFTEKDLVKPLEQRIEFVKKGQKEGNINGVNCDITSEAFMDIQQRKIINQIGDSHLNSHTTKRPLPNKTNDIPAKKVCKPKDKTLSDPIQYSQSLSNSAGSGPSIIPIKRNSELIQFFEVSNERDCKQSPEVATSSNTTPKLNAKTIQNACGSPDVICISDNEEDKVPCTKNAPLITKKKLTENESIVLLFDKYYRKRIKDNQSQTFAPRNRNVQILNSNLVCLSNMYKELFTYRIPVHLEFSSTINASIKIAENVSPPQCIEDWSTIPVSTIRSVIEESQSTTLSSKERQSTVPTSTVPLKESQFKIPKHTVPLKKVQQSPPAKSVSLKEVQCTTPAFTLPSKESQFKIPTCTSVPLKKVQQTPLSYIMPLKEVESITAAYTPASKESQSSTQTFSVPLKQNQLKIPTYTILLRNIQQASSTYTLQSKKKPKPKEGHSITPKHTARTTTLPCTAPTEVIQSTIAECTVPSINLVLDEAALLKSTLPIKQATQWNFRETPPKTITNNNVPTEVISVECSPPHNLPNNPFLLNNTKFINKTNADEYTEDTTELFITGPIECNLATVLNTQSKTDSSPMLKESHDISAASTNLNTTNQRIVTHKYSELPNNNYMQILGNQKSTYPLPARLNQRSSMSGMVFEKSRLKTQTNGTRTNQHDKLPNLTGVNKETVNQTTKSNTNQVPTTSSISFSTNDAQQTISTEYSDSPNDSNKAIIRIKPPWKLC